jgi:RHS repeat-associated protein
LKCSGSNGDDQLGQPDITYSTAPQVVVFASSNYTYGSSTHDHAVTALSTGETYGYDANGNMTTRTEGGVSYTQTFDAENRLISITAGGLTTQFLYDGDGNLVKKIKTDGSKTIYVGGIYEVDKNSGGTVTGTKTYYPAAGAMRVGSTLYYVLKDHLGSASVVTNTSGTIVGEDRFYPFGETRFTTGTMFTDKLYTGQREITGLGIYHYGARFYSPKLGRFLSADTIVPGYANPQNLNRYTYVINNPLRYTDPTGHMFDDGCSMGCGGSTTYVYDPPTNPNNDDDEDNEPLSGGGGTGCNLDTMTNAAGQYCHDYTTPDVTFCPTTPECSETQAATYLTQFQYPGQLPWNPVQAGGSYTVFPFNLAPTLGYLTPALIPLGAALDQIISPYGAITVDIEPNGLAATNQTEPTHIFHQGQVENNITQHPDGSWTVSSHGTGTNSSYGVAVFNQYVGSFTFQVTNNVMAAYVFVDQATFGALP